MFVIRVKLFFYSLFGVFVLFSPSALATIGLLKITGSHVLLKILGAVFVIPIFLLTYEVISKSEFSRSLDELYHEYDNLKVKRVKIH